MRVQADMMSQNDERAFNGDCTLVAILLVVLLRCPCEVFRYRKSGGLMGILSRKNARSFLTKKVKFMLLKRNRLYNIFE